MNFRCERRFVGAVDPCKIHELAAPGFGVKPLDIAPFAFFQRCIDKNLDELSAVEKATRHFALAAEGGNKSDNDDQTGIHQKLGDLGNATKVFDAVSLGKSKIPIQAVADIIAVENVRMFAFGMKALFQQIGNRGFSRTGETGEPEAARLLMFDLGARGLGDVQGLPMNVDRSAESKSDET